MQESMTSEKEGGREMGLTNLPEQILRYPVLEVPSA